MDYLDPSKLPEHLRYAPVGSKHCHQNTENDVSADEPGSSLKTHLNETHQINTQHLPDCIQDNVVEGGSNTVFNLQRVVLHFPQLSTSIPVTDKYQALIGRRDPGNAEQPDVDLTPYSGYRMGISRRHARLTCNTDGQLLICDLGSSNGTYLNEMRLMPHVLHLLKHGDTIRFGKLVAQIALRTYP